MSEKASPFGRFAKGSSTGGQDTSDLTKELAQKDTTQLNVEIPKSLHKQLKMHCL
jgi:hypothetical protein